LPEPSASASNAAASSLPPTGVSPGEGQAGSAGATKPAPKAKSEVANVVGEGEAKSGAKVAPVAEVEEEWDLDGEKVSKKRLEDVFKRQKDFERSSHKRLQEAAEARKAAAAREAEIENAFGQLKTDPYAVYRAAGYSDAQIDEIAEQRLLTRMKRAQMTPEQIEAEQMRTRLQTAEQKLAEQQHQQEQTKTQALQKQYFEHYDQQIGQAMELGNLPRTVATAAEVAEIMAEHLQPNGTTIDPALATQIVRTKQRATIGHHFGELHQQLTAGRITPQRYMSHVSEMLGPETIKAIQQTAIKQAQDFEPQKPRVASKTAPLPKKQFDSFDEANAWIGKRINNQ